MSVFKTYLQDLEEAPARLKLNVLATFVVKHNTRRSASFTRSSIAVLSVSLAA
eukprot:Gb_07663 [translate_table: standard]